MAKLIFSLNMGPKATCQNVITMIEGLANHHKFLFKDHLEENLNYFIDTHTEDGKYSEVYSNIPGTKPFISEGHKVNYKGVHMAHCYQGEYPNQCKYLDETCPAKIEKD